jgi:hypothetical protein
MTDSEGRPEWFFFCESSMYRGQHPDWSLDEKLVHLLHCRGYNPKWVFGSTYGLQGAQLRAGLSRTRYERAMRAQIGRGVLIDAGDSRYKPVTLIMPLDEEHRPEPESDAWQELLTQRDRYLGVRVDLTFLPWTLLQEDETVPTLRDIRTTTEIDLLLCLYDYADEQPDVPASLFRLSEDGVVEAGRDTCTDPDEVLTAGKRLVDVGLLLAGEDGAVSLRHPMPARDADEEEEVG